VHSASFGYFVWTLILSFLFLLLFASKVFFLPFFKFFIYFFVPFSLLINGDAGSPFLLVKRVNKKRDTHRGGWQAGYTPQAYH